MPRNPTESPFCRSASPAQEDGPFWHFQGAPLGLDVFRGISGAGRGLETKRSASSSQRDPSGYARSGHFVHHRRRSFNLCCFPECSPAQIVDDLKARSSSGKCADEGNACLRASTSAEAGLRPSVQAARTRKAVSTNSLGLIDRLLPLSIF